MNIIIRSLATEEEVGITCSRSITAQFLLSQRYFGLAGLGADVDELVYMYRIGMITPQLSILSAETCVKTFNLSIILWKVPVIVKLSEIVTCLLSG